MLQKMRKRMESEKGFTLIELLVVVLIIGILAAIAIPAFLGQREKAQDGSAKSMVRNAASAAEAYKIDTTNNDYTGMDAAALKKIEPSLNDTAGVKTGIAVTLSGTTGYTLSVESKSSKSGSEAFFNLTKSGDSQFRCKAAAAATACAQNTW